MIDMVKVLLLAVTAAMVPACSSGSSSSSGTPAQTKCEVLANTLCEEVVMCTTDAGINSTLDMQCMQSSASDCSNVVGTGPTIDQCINDLAGWPCSKFNPNETQPPSCKGVLIVKDGG